MNELITQQVGVSLSFGSILLASLIGSPHCGAMCGGFAALAGSSTPTGVVLYNTGRLLTYCILGALAGALGSALNIGGEFLGYSQIAAFIVGMIMIGIGVRQLSIASRPLRTNSPSRIVTFFEQQYLGILNRFAADHPKRRAFLLGALSTLLPCGWLYSFATLAASTGSPLAAVGVMIFFWLGTLPMLVGVGTLSRLVGSTLTPYLPRLVPLLFIVAGVSSIWIHLSSVIAVRCH